MSKTSEEFTKRAALWGAVGTLAVCALVVCSLPGKTDYQALDPGLFAAAETKARENLAQVQYSMEPAKHFETLDLRAESQSNHGIVTGRNKNIGSRPCGEIHLNFTVLDQQGQKVRFAKVSYRDGMQPGEVWSSTAKAGVYRAQGAQVRLDPVTGITAFP